MTKPARVLQDVLLESLDDFIGFLQQQRRLSHDYLVSARRIIGQFAVFCGMDGASSDTNPWQMRQCYLAKRNELRAAEPLSHFYLKDHGNTLRDFAAWFVEQPRGVAEADGRRWQRLMAMYQAASGRRSAFVRRVLERHLAGFVDIVDAAFEQRYPVDVQDMVSIHLERRRQALRCKPYGMVMHNRAQVVTRRHLLWLERQEHLKAGTAHRWSMLHSDRLHQERNSKQQRKSLPALDRTLPLGLRTPLSQWLDDLAHHKCLSPRRIASIRRCLVKLCRHLAERGITLFGEMTIQHIDQVVIERVPPIAPDETKMDILRRRQQVRSRHSELRPFLRYLHQRGLIRTELDKAVISPPCYRASRPPQGLSQKQLSALLQSVDRTHPPSLLVYAILTLVTTYGLRPSDVAALTLDDIHWRPQTLSLVQVKTGNVLTLPLVQPVANALLSYLRQGRTLGSSHRELLLQPQWPHRPLSARAVADRVKVALRAAGLDHYSARHLRHSVAMALLRQGEALCTIQAILGHRDPDTTQRYAVTDPVLLRRVLEEDQR